MLQLLTASGCIREARHRKRTQVTISDIKCLDGTVLDAETDLVNWFPIKFVAC
jgi:hypothetical protein